MRRKAITNNPDSIFIHIKVMFDLIFVRLKNFVAMMFCFFIIASFNNSNSFLAPLKTPSIYYVQNFYGLITSPIIAIDRLYDSVADYLNAVIYNKQIISENTELRQEIDRLKIEANENKKLRKLLHMTSSDSSEEITVRIIANASDPHIKTFTINAGSNNGIKPGQILVNQNGLIGKVIDSADNIAKILSVTDINFKIPAIFSKSRVKSIISGMSFSNDTLIADLIPLDEKIEDGEPVLTSGEGDLTPYGILIGYAYNDPSGKIIIKSSVNWEDLEYAQIISHKN